MKNKLTFISFLLMAIFFVSLNSHPHKNSGQAPSGRTGAPGESTCSGCHSGGTFNGQIDFMLGENATTYIPGETYVVNFTSNYDSPRHGFSLTVLDAENNLAGELVVTNDNNTSFATANSRQYVGHKNADSNKTWQFNWTAPETDQGTITFYYVINASDDNGSTSGDMIVTGSTSIEPASAQMYSLTIDINPQNAGTTSGDGDYEEGDIIAIQANPNEGYTFVNWTDGENELSNQANFDFNMPAEDVTLSANFEEVTTDLPGVNNKPELSLFPNPSSDFVTLQSESMINQAEILDVSGKRILQMTDLSQKNIDISLADLRSGTYFIRVVSESGLETIRFIKK